MVNINSELAKRVINSDCYARLIDELKAELNIKVLDSYEDVFSDMDGASITRSGLTPEELESLFVMNAKSLKAFSTVKYKKLNCVPDEQDYPPGEEPDESDKDSKVVSQGYARGFLLGNGIEFLLAKKGSQYLEAYLKSSRIPKASVYAKEIMGFIR
ncbi:hypothetical protein N5D61_02375 [Pseudomonas sp. GD03842]|uniref:hypothetical protein n=1 Tax=Pseudomonas sp. GD03842 TaxID=2975385 RepID=UPI00244724D7|nr:hypothetical protein [Pseudomonas sp. GD03842]MDH0745192.1 hypothetical protein [Pseudomonas sp. GD03842]